MDEEAAFDPDADLNEALRQFGLPPVSPGGWDDPADDQWGDL
jgi:hypothetical protein